jgi:predicted amidophosphoribosyltransferase
MKCWKCGINELNTGDGDGICLSCKNKLNPNYIKPIYYQSGWICPKCGSVYGPGQNECIRCNPPIIPQVTC